MNAWGESCQEANQSLISAIDAMGDLFTCYNRDIKGKTRVSKTTARQIGSSLSELRAALQRLAPLVSGVADAQSAAMLSFLAGKRLDREQFYILLATECVEWTNRNVGLSDFDDFELFELLRYRGKDQSGYIYLAADIDELPEVGPDDWVLGFLSRTYRKAIIAPEAIEWDSLTQKQRWFFQKYLPESVARFIHEEPIERRPASRRNTALQRRTAARTNTTRVNVQELIAALKALKAHQKSRRNMDLLIRKSDQDGELVLQLCGRPRYAGILTTVSCAGRWNIQALAPFGSFRGFVNYPPDGDTAEMEFSDGRLRIGAWSCPAKRADVE